MCDSQEMVKIPYLCAKTRMKRTLHKGRCGRILGFCGASAGPAFRGARGRDSSIRQSWANVMALEIGWRINRVF